VTVATAVAQDVPVYLDEIGKCAAVELVNVMPQVSGRITERHFTDGDDVKKGDLLFTIDPRPFESELAKNQATLKQNQASLALAKTEFARVENLNKSHAASQTEYDTARNTVDVDDALVDATEALVQTAKLNLEYCYIRSPVDGRTGIRMADPGNIVKANETQLVVVQRRDPIYVDFTTTERNLPSIRQHMAAGPLKVLVSAPGYDGAPGEGQLTFVDTSVQPGTGTVKLRATMPNPGQRFSPGQFVNVRLVLQIKKDAVLVPGQTVQVGQDGPFVYLLKGKEHPDPNKPAMATADQRPIKAGQLQGDLIVIEQGVAPGDEVIVTGQMAIGPGAKVQVLPPLAPGGPGAPGGASSEHADSAVDIAKPATRPGDGAIRGNSTTAPAAAAAEGRTQS
jgi:multidrug efflux system membrane fusion protein